jgi:stage V sporulation protein D (sporulation-specific penicillin-binding protein)
VARLFTLQVLEAEALRHAARVRRERRRPLLARRGAILDRHGQPLAQTTFYYHLAIDPRTVRNPTEAARWLAHGLGLSQEALEAVIRESQARNARYQRVATFVPQHRAEPFLQAYRAMPMRQRPALLMREVIPARELPEKRLAAQVIGLTTVEESGEHGAQLKPLCGIELQMERVLQGRNGYEEGEIAPGGVIIPETLRARQSPIDGQPVRLTLDSTIQEAVEEALDALYRQHKPVGALALVLDPHTGEILALANRPTFDPVTRKELARSTEPLRNRAITFLYEPGSTLKPITIAAALDEGIIRPSDRFGCLANFKVGRKPIRCVLHGRRHGWQTPEEVLKNSCNIASAQIGLRCGLERLYRALQRFHLLEPTGVELPAEWSGWTDPPERVNYGRALRAANLAFGQGLFVAPPLALAAAYGVFANEGRLGTAPPALWAQRGAPLHRHSASNGAERATGAAACRRRGHGQTRPDSGLLDRGQNGHRPESYPPSRLCARQVYRLLHRHRARRRTARHRHGAGRRASKRVLWRRGGGTNFPPNRPVPALVLADSTQPNTPVRPGRSV